MQVCISCGHENRPGVLFCENCGTSLTGQPGAGSTKGLEDEIQPGLSEQVVTAGTDYLAPGGALRVEIEGGPEPIVIMPRQELIFGRRDPATGAMPDIDLTPYAGYRMGVSRRHAAIRSAEENHLDVWDLGSSNGTYLNGVRLNPHRPYRLHDGDRIRLGQMVIRILFTAPQQEEGAPSTALQAAIAAAAAAEAAAQSPQEPAPRTRNADELEAAINAALAAEAVAEAGAAPATPGESPGEDSQPAAGDSQPAVADEQPAAADEQPAAGDSQPAVVDEQPATAEDNLSAPGNEPPAATDEEAPPAADEPAGTDSGAVDLLAAPDKPAVESLPAPQAPAARLPAPEEMPQETHPAPPEPEASAQAEAAPESEPDHDSKPE